MKSLLSALTMAFYLMLSVPLAIGVLAVSALMIFPLAWLLLAAVLDPRSAIRIAPFARAPIAPVVPNDVVGSRPDRMHSPSGDR